MARAASSAITIDGTLQEFLHAVDAKPKWVDRALAAFKANDITEAYELEGADSKLCCKIYAQSGQTVLGGLEGFMERAVNKYRKVVKESKDEKRRTEDANR